MRHFKLATTLTLLCCTLAFATEYTWDGEGAGGKQWTNDLMWAGDAKPTMSADNTLVFDGTSYIITTNTFPMHSDIGWIKIAPTAAPFLFARQSSSLGDRLDVFSGFEHNAANVVSNLMATDVWGDWMVNVSDPAGELHQVGVMLTEDNVAHAISKLGPGKYQLFGNNAGLTGTVTVADGTLVVRSVTSLGAAVSDVIVSNGATLDMYGRSVLRLKSLALMGSGVGSTGTLITANGAASLTNTIALGSDVVIGCHQNTITLGAGVGYGGGEIGCITGAYGITKLGPAMLYLRANNSFSGPLSVGQGNLGLYMTNAYSQLAVKAGTTYLNGWNTNAGARTAIVGAVVNLSNDYNLSDAPAAFDVSNIFLDANGQLYTRGDVDLDSTRGIWLGADGGRISSSLPLETNASVISGPGALTLSTANMQVMGDNDYEGGTYVIGGSGVRATFFADANLGAVPVPPAVNVTVSNTWTMLLFYEDMTLHQNRKVLLTDRNQIHVRTGRTLTLAGELMGDSLYLSPGGGSAPGTNPLDKVELRGTLVLVPGNTYTNRTTVNLGTLSISADSCLGTPPPEPLVNSLIMGGDSPGELAYNAILKATETFTLHANRGVQLLNAANAFEVVDGRTLTIAGDIGSNPNGGLNKAGNGLLKLTGACSWTGATAIAAGTLEFAPTVDCALEGAVTGSGELKLTGTGKVTFAGANDYSGNTTVSSGTIGGSGSPNSTMTIANGAGVAPGASIGVFQASNLAVAEGSAYDWEVDHTGPAADLVDVVNTLTLPSAANSVTVTLQNFSGGSGTFTAALYEFGSLAGDVASLKLDVASSGYAPTAPYVSGNSILVDLQPVPEPMVLGAVALAAAVLIRRRS